MSIMHSHKLKIKIVQLNKDNSPLKKEENIPAKS